MRHIINENGMSIKLVQLCNESETFRDQILTSFKNGDDEGIVTDKIDDIKFTGDTPIQIGEDWLKPDITIRYKTGEKAYIEVKTNKDTDYQLSQNKKKSSKATEESPKEEEKQNYLKLLEVVNNVILDPDSVDDVYLKKHFGYLLDQKHYDEFEHSENNSYPIASWNKVYEIVKDFGYRDFERDIKENVDGVITEEDEIKFTSYELALLYQPRLLNFWLNNLKDFKLKEGDKISDVPITDAILKNNKGDFTTYNFTKDNDYDGFLLSTEDDKQIDKMYFGWQTDLLDRTTDFDKETKKNEKNNEEKNDIKENIKKTKLEDYLYSFSVHKERLNMKKVIEKNKKGEINYLEDEYGWVYFPIKENEKLDEYIKNVDNPNNVYAYDTEDKLRVYKKNICTAIILSNKIEKVLEKVRHLIIEKLTQNKLDYAFDVNNDRSDDYIRYIYYSDNTLSYGIMPWVFNVQDEDKRKIEDKGFNLTDYFLSVCFEEKDISSNFENSLQTALSNVLVDSKQHCIYYPINPITLCNDKDLGPFVDEVVRIIQKYLNLKKSIKDE